jgi:peptidyl-prolyl cis-trans isomerase D
MLQTMRNNAQGMIAKVIVGFIIFVFAIWGVESIVTLGGGPKPAATVGGVDISEEEIARAVQQQKNELRRQFGEQFDENLFNDQMLRASALEQLINQTVAKVQADDMGLRASARLIDEMIVTTPAFQSDGIFDREQFINILRINGLTPLTYRAQLAESLKVNQARAAFILSSFTTPFDVKLQQALANEQRTISYYSVNAKDLTASVELTDEDIQAAYEANLENFMTPERVAIRYIEISRASIEKDQDVTDDDLTFAYEDHVAKLIAAEERSASHILLEIRDDRDETKALSLARELKARIDAGESFAAIAKEYSDDKGTADVGGDLGINLRGTFDPVFEDVLYALNEGEVSAPVETEYGIHLIRVDHINAPEIPSQESIRDELAAQVRKEKAGFAFAELIQEFSNTAFSAGSINELADVMNLTPQETGLFTMEKGEGVAAEEKVRREAFADNMKLDHELSSVIDLDDRAIVFAVSDYQESLAKPLDQVRAQVEARLTREKALAAANKKALAILAGDESVEWQTATGTVMQNMGVARAVQQRAFTLAEGEADVVGTPEGYSVVKLDNVDRKDWKDMEVTEEAAQASRMQRSREDMISYQAWSKSVTDIAR